MHLQQGLSIEQIAGKYELELADVHAALAYYYENRQALDATVVAGEDLANSLRERFPSKLKKSLRGEMPDRIRFHLDEHVDPDIALALRRHGIDVSTTNQLGPRTKDDPAHLEFIRLESPVMVTHDPDFLRLAAGGAEHPGTAFCPSGRLSMGEIIRGLILIYEVMTPQEMRGHVEYL